MRQTQKPFLVFTFKGRQFVDYVVVGEYPSGECALRDTDYPNHLRTRLIVLAKKGRRNNPVTHSLAKQGKAHEGKWYVCAVEEKVFLSMCARAEQTWIEQKRKTRQLIECAPVCDGSERLDLLASRLRERIVLRANGCWTWRSSSRTRRNRSLGRYGRVRFEGKTWGAHRLIYTLLVGELPAGAILLHICDEPSCVNPGHLRPGLIEDNVRDMVKKGRAAWQKRAAD